MFSITFCLISLGMFFLFILFLLQLLKDEEFDRIPGPKGIFLLGNSLNLLADAVTTYKNFRELARVYKKIFKLRIFSMKLVFIYSPEDAEALLNSNKYSKKGYSYGFFQPWLNDGLLLSYGKKWQQRRKILTPAFHFNLLNIFFNIFVNRCDKLIKQLEAEANKNKTAANVYTDEFALNTICETAMGVTLDDELNGFGDKYKEAIHDLGSALYKRFTRFWLYPDIIFKHSITGHTQNKQLRLISSFSNRVIQTRRNNQKDTESIPDEHDEFYGNSKKLAMLDILLKAAEEGKIDEDGIREEVDTFIFEGFDTTSTSLQFTFMLLANHGNMQDKIVSELDHILGTSDRVLTMRDLAKMKYLECCIKESLRLYPSVSYISRRIEEPIQLNDYVCPAGVEIVVMIYDLHRQADQFPEPLKFKPERFMVEPTWHRFAYVPFSAGPRNCIGQKFAMLEMKLMVASVLRKYRLLPITKPQDIQIRADVVTRPKYPIYVKFEKRYERKN